MIDLGVPTAAPSPERRTLLEAKLAQAAEAKASHMPLARDETLPPVASLLQESFWAMEQIKADTSRLNLGFAFSLKGPLDLQAMESALSALIERHEVLRARFSAGPQGDLRVETMPCWQFALTFQDFTFQDFTFQDFAESAATDVGSVLDAALQAEVNRPFRVDSEPLIRGVLYRLGDDHHLLQLTTHLLVIDDSGVAIAFRDLAELYNSARSAKRAQLPNLPMRFTDFARSHREQMTGPEGESLLAYWLDHLAGSSTVLSLPTDRPRPIHQTFRGNTLTYAVPSALTAAIQECCLRENVTPYMVLLTAVYSVFAKYTGQNDILIGSPMAARTQIETEQMLGCFTNIVVLRGKLDGDPSFHDMLQRVRITVLDAVAHPDLPVDMLTHKLPVERDPSRSPMVQVLVVDQNTTIGAPQFDGLDVMIKPVVTDSSKRDLTIELNPVGDALKVNIEFNTDLFDSSTIDRLWSHMAAFLERGIADPEQKVSAIPLHTAEQLQQLLVDWNQTQSDYPKDVPLASLVEAQVARTPHAIAVVCGAQHLTFSQLNERANQLAHRLRSHGAGPDQLIGLCLDRSADLLVALLAIIKAGAAYLPIDPLLPADRVQYIFHDSGVRLLLTEQSFAHQFPAFDGSMILMEDESWQNAPQENLNVAVDPKSLAYLLYTSGSTGKPKGVQVSRQALINLLWSMRDWFQFSAADRLLALTTISFDIAGVDVWLPLLAGAQIVLATREDAADGNVLRGLIERHDITFMQATPVSWRLLFLAGWKQKSNLQAICTGEAMPADLAAQLLPAVKCLSATCTGPRRRPSGRPAIR
jgi:non-ribosomal peptide synthetase component F